MESNDASTMARTLADDHVLVDGYGKAYTKTDCIEDARGGETHYVHQDDSAQTVRVWGDTAVVTGKLRAQGTEDGKKADYTLWSATPMCVRPRAGATSLDGVAATAQGASEAHPGSRPHARNKSAGLIKHFIQQVVTGSFPICVTPVKDPGPPRCCATVGAKYLVPPTRDEFGLGCPKECGARTLP